jgi:hypothetical protein
MGRNVMMRRVPFVFVAMRQESSGKAFRANLQRERATAAGHETTRNERAERVCDNEEASEPPALAYGCKADGHSHQTCYVRTLHRS